MTRRFTLGLLAAAVFAITPLSAQADSTTPTTPTTPTPPTSTTPAVVSVGDSAISGEAGRWAGNTNGSSSLTDAYSWWAYYDNADGSGEEIPGCHRSLAAEVHIGGGVASKNLACSYARTYTQPYVSGYGFKPGLDFYDDGAGHIGQAKALQQYASTHDVKAVVALIGANDYAFTDVLQTCVTNWLLSPWFAKDYCSDDPSVTRHFTPSNVDRITKLVADSYRNIRQAMRNAGYADNAWRLFAQTYWSPLPRGEQVRYHETGYTRQTVGGCGFWNRDLDWANDMVVTTLNSTIKNAARESGLGNVRILDQQSLLDGHRLCEKGVGLLEEQGVPNWAWPGASDKTEWVQQVRTLSTVGGPYQFQESGHASVWGQRAMRNCFRQAYNSSDPRGGWCRFGGNGLTAQNEPRVIYTRFSEY